MIVAVDVILGPLLTFIVYKPQKPTLKFDLTTIAAIQIAALGYGMYTVYQAHPLYVAYAIDRFSPIDASEVSPSNAKFEELNKSKLAGPTLVYLQKPTDRAEMSKITMEVMSGKADLDARTEYYFPLNQKIDEVKNRDDMSDDDLYNLFNQAPVTTTTTTTRNRSSRRSWATSRRRSWKHRSPPGTTIRTKASPPRSPRTGRCTRSTCRR